MARAIRFLVQTRWALALWSDEPPPSDWVETRRALLLSVTIPSLAQQTDQDFTWLVYVDSGLADQEAEILTQTIAGRFDYSVVPVDGRLNAEQVEKPVIERVSPGEWVATARLDSDDALGPRYIERARKALSSAVPPVSVDFPDGVMVDRNVGIPLSRPYADSAFQTLLAEVGATNRVLTGLHFDHSQVGHHVPYYAIRTTEPQWFVAIHSMNTSSRAFVLPRPSSVVPEHLRRGLGVRDSTRTMRGLYLANRSISYARTLVRDGDVRRRIRRASMAFLPHKGASTVPKTDDEK